MDEKRHGDRLSSRTGGEDGYRVLVASPLIRDSIREYEDLFARHGVAYDVSDAEQQLTEEELLDCIEGYDGVLAGDDEFTGRVLRTAPELKVISKWGIGTDNIDQRAAEEQGVAVYNTPGVMGDSVADVVLGYAVMLLRHLHSIDTAVRDGRWASPRGTTLAGKTFGIVGVGNIGSAVARRAAAFGTALLGHHPRPISEGLRDDVDIDRVALDDLLCDSDVVSLHCPLSEETEGMIGPGELALLGDDGYLINTARGGVVNQSALLEALESGTIAGAALDVFRDEPLPPDDPLVELDNVILGSHNAGNTREAVAETNARAVCNLLAGLGIDVESRT